MVLASNPWLATSTDGVGKELWIPRSDAGCWNRIEVANDGKFKLDQSAAVDRLRSTTIAHQENIKRYSYRFPIEDVYQWQICGKTMTSILPLALNARITQVGRYRRRIHGTMIMRDGCLPAKPSCSPTTDQASIAALSFFGEDVALRLGLLLRYTG